MNTPNNPTPTSSISFNSQPYPVYLGGYQADLATRTAMALQTPKLLKMNVTLHVAHEALMPVVEQTARHYRHAVNRLMQGHWGSAENVATARESWEAQIGEVDTEIKEHLTKRTMLDKQPLVSVWGDAVLLVNGQYYWLSINKCDETTAANDLLRAVRVAFSTLKLDQPSEALLYTPPLPKEQIDAALARLHKQAQSPPPIPPQQFNNGEQKRVDTSHVQSAPMGTGTPKPDSMVDGYKHVNLANGGEVHFPIAGENKSGTPHFLQFPSNAAAKQAFGADYGGQVVSFEMQKANRSFNATTGEPEYELYAMSNYEWPSIKYIKPNPQYIKDQATLSWLGSIQGETIGRWRVVCYVSVKGDKVYFNVNKVTGIEGTIPSELIDDTPAQPMGQTPPTRVLKDGKPPMDSGLAVPPIEPPPGNDIPF